MVRAKLGLRQGELGSPILFRWIPGDVNIEVIPKWEQLSSGVMLHGYRPMLLEWVSDTWIVAEDIDELDRMIADLRAIAQRRIGLQLRLPKHRCSAKTRTRRRCASRTVTNI